MFDTLSLLQLFTVFFYHANGDITIHHCSFTSATQVGTGPNWYYEFDENDCTNGKPSGNCVIGFKRTQPQCDARYGILPGQVQSAAGFGVNGPAVIVHMSGNGQFNCQENFDGGINRTNLFYEIDYFCIDSGNDTQWRTICEQIARPGNTINIREDNLRTVQPLFINATDCDNGLPVPAVPVFAESSDEELELELDGSGGCVQFRHDGLFPGTDFGQITFDADDERFPGMEFYLFRETEVPITRTEIGYICNVAGLDNYQASGSSGSSSSGNSGTGTSDESSSSSSSDDDNDGEYKSYTCSLLDGNAGDVLGGFSNGNEISGEVEYVFYEFEDDNCIDNQGRNNIPPSIENGDADCVVSIRSERDCGTQEFLDFQTREAFNNGEIDNQTGRKGPAILYSRPINKGCENEETIMQVDYLCKE